MDSNTPIERKILATHYPIIHAFLALALAHHTGVHNETPGLAVEKIMSALYAENKDYNAMKREYKDIARAIAYQAKKAWPDHRRRENQKSYGTGIAQNVQNRG